jgi:hypothetical protein
MQTFVSDERTNRELKLTKPSRDGAEARRVELQRSRLTVAALPLEVAQVSDPITSDRP